MKSLMFENGACSGDPYNVLDTSFEQKCQPDKTSPGSFIHSRCSQGTADFESLKPGLMLGFHEDAGCSGSPISFTHTPLDTCMLDVDEGVDGVTSISFIKLESCSPFGEVTVKVYSDSSCSNELYTTKASAASTLNNFNTCGYNKEAKEYEMFKCVQPTNAK